MILILWAVVLWLLLFAIPCLLFGRLVAYLVSRCTGRP